MPCAFPSITMCVSHNRILHPDKCIGTSEAQTIARSIESRLNNVILTYLVIDCISFLKYFSCFYLFYKYLYILNALKLQLNYNKVTKRVMLLDSKLPELPGSPLVLGDYFFSTIIGNVRLG